MAQVPGVLSHALVDEWVKTEDEGSFTRAKELIRTEGLLIGGSCGAVLDGTLRFLESKSGERFAQDSNATIVLIFADS